MNRCKKRHEPVHGVHHSQNTEERQSAVLTVGGCRAGENTPPVRGPQPDLEAAERLLSALAWSDEEAGVRIIPMSPPGTLGLARGSGHHVALAHGHAAGRAVYINVPAITNRWMGVKADFDGFGNERLASLWRDRLLEVAQTEFEQVGTHELAHCIVARRDGNQPDEADFTACRSLTTAPFTQSVERRASGHPIRWAIAYAILAERAMKLRPHMAAYWRMLVEHDLRSFTFDYESLRSVAAKVRHGESIAALVADDAFMATVNEQGASDGPSPRGDEVGIEETNDVQRC